MVDLNTAEALALRKAMENARDAFLKAQADYQRAFAIAKDTEQNPDGMLSLRRAARDYAQALAHHTTAAMEWLVYLDRLLRTPQSTEKGAGE